MDADDLVVTLTQPLWRVEIAELVGKNIETRGRTQVNKLLKQGWILLHIYTLKYPEDGVWRERPMAILGKPKNIPSSKLL